MFTRQDIKRGVLVGLLYEQKALLRAYGSKTFKEREAVLDKIADEICDIVEKQQDTKLAPAE